MIRIASVLTVSALAACASAPPTLDADGWLVESRPMGAGHVAATHVRAERDAIRLIADGPSRMGAALRTRDAWRAGTFRAELRCNAPRGAVCALFLYETDAGDRADEIDIELIAGTREIWLTTWVAGERTNHVALELPFDPAGALHAYEIRWHAGRVEFAVDGEPLARFDDGVPRRAMALFANAWWPAWLEPSAYIGDLEIRTIGRVVQHES